MLVMFTHVHMYAAVFEFKIFSVADMFAAAAAAVAAGMCAELTPENTGNFPKACEAWVERGQRYAKCFLIFFPHVAHGAGAVLPLRLVREFAFL